MRVFEFVVVWSGVVWCCVGRGRVFHDDESTRPLAGASSVQEIEKGRGEGKEREVHDENSKDRLRYVLMFLILGK